MESLNITTKYLTESEAADYLGLSKFTMRNWRFLKKGPKSRKFGKSVRYSIADIEEWASKNSIF